MKRIPKKILGLFGLLLVAVMTIVAAALPGTGVQAVSSVTDTIVVRVVGYGPDVSITEPESGSVFLDPERTIEYDYEHVTNLQIIVDYTDKDGKIHAYIIDDYAPDKEAGNGKFTLDLSEERFGYGEYIVRIVGESKSGEPAQSAIKFSYYPFIADVEEDEDSGDPTVILDYDDDNEDLEVIEINVYDGDGKLVKFSPVKVKPTDKDATLPFADNNLPKGKYKIVVTAYNGEDKLFKEVTLYFDYDPIPVPNTGNFLQKLNISKADYLITSLLVFFAISLVSITFVIRKKNTRK